MGRGEGIGRKRRLKAGRGFLRDWERMRKRTGEVAREGGEGKDGG